MLRLVATLLIAALFGALPAAESVAALAGTWSAERVAVPGGVPNFFTLAVAGAQVTISRNKGPLETYTLDGSETRLPDGRVASARFTDQTLTLILRRTRSRPEQEPFVTTMRETYRLEENRLVLERSVARPSGEWIPTAKESYQRAPR